MIEKQMILLSLLCKGKTGTKVNKQKPRVVPSFWWKENTMSQNINGGLVIDLVSVCNSNWIKKKKCGWETPPAEQNRRYDHRLHTPVYGSWRNETPPQLLSWLSQFLSYPMQDSPSLACERGEVMPRLPVLPPPPPSLASWHFVPTILGGCVSSSFLPVTQLLLWGIKHPVNARQR